ncbi:MAG: hypothetical protein H6712_31170 [Myxococcales bacterium]|nr:hypothetical protein [Myxococcales bacterium]MCB9718353.1 hypothetical protein [Myxococcales bacterium]
MRARWITIWLSGLLLACPSGDDEGGSTDSGTTTTASTGPAPATDTSTTAGSTGPADGTTGDDGSTGPATGSTGATAGSTGEASSDDGSTGGGAGLGEIMGDCGLIDAMELSSPSPFTFESSIDFRDLGFDYDRLTPEGQQVYDAGNLGGSSLHSEVIAFEVLARCEGAHLLATEGEIVYLDDMGTKTDILVEIDGLVVGVSVTRAVGFPFEDPYTVMQAESLITGKLEDILASTANVAPRDAWVKQILHVIAYADMHAQSIMTAYAGLPPEITADTILLVTVTNGNDAFIY